MTQFDEQDVRVQIHAVVRDLAPSFPAEVREGDRLIEDLEYHSLALLELAFALEDEFELPPLDEQRAASIATVGDIDTLVVDQLVTEGRLRQVDRAG